MKGKRVLVVAQCCCDLIFAGLPGLPCLGQEVYGKDFAMKPGGGANTPISLARLGIPTTLLTQIGADSIGENLVSELTAAGVRLTGDIALPGTRTAVSAVLSTREDRSFASYGGSGGDFAGAVLEKEIMQSDIVHTYFGYCRSYPIADLCEKYGKILSLDVSWADTEDASAAGEILKKCDYLKVNALEAARLTGEKTAEEGLLALSDRVRRGTVVTLGSAGSIGSAHGSPEILRFGPVSCGSFRDSCGAGDSYSAGMLYGLARDLPFSACMTLGSIVAGHSVTWYGGNDSTLNCTKIEDEFRLLQRI